MALTNLPALQKFKPPVTPPMTGGFLPGNAVPGQTPFSQGTNLIGTQINPTTSPRQDAASGMVDQAANQVSNATFSPFQPAMPINTSGSNSVYNQLLQSVGAPALPGGGGVASAGGGARGTMNTLLERMSQAPDRSKLATDMYDVLETRANPAFQQRLRSVGQRAGALGRVRAGLTTSELGDVELLHNRDLDLSRRQLATEGAGLTLSDIINQIGAARGVFDSESAADVAGGRLNLDRENSAFGNRMALGRDLYGRESDAYGRGVGERDALYDYEDRRFGNERNRLGDLSIYENDIYGRGRDSRNEYRGERDYQYDAERDARGDYDRDRAWNYGVGRDQLGDRERQWEMQQDAQQRAWERAYAGAGMGYGTNPAGAYGARGAQQGQQAQDTMATMGPLFLEWARRNRGTAAPPSSTPPDAMGY